MIEMKSVIDNSINLISNPVEGEYIESRYVYREDSDHAIMDGDVELPQLFDESDDDIPDDNVKIISGCPPELEIEAAKWAEKYKVDYDDDFNEYGEGLK